MLERTDNLHHEARKVLSSDSFQSDSDSDDEEKYDLMKDNEDINADKDVE